MAAVRPPAKADNEQQQLKELFEQFDEDKSGAVSADEVTNMMEQLGMFANHELVAQMVKDADADKSGEIDFQEFVSIISKQREMTTSSPAGGRQGGIAAIALRKKKNEAAMRWRSDKTGPGVELDHKTQTITRQGQGWGTQLLDIFLAEPYIDSGSVLLECEACPGPCFVGIVGVNYNACDWDDPLKDNQHAVVVDAETGMLYHKKSEKPLLKMRKLEAGYRVQIQINMVERSMDLQIIGTDRENALSRCLGIMDIPLQVAIAVSMGPSDTPHKWRVVGSSCETTRKISKKTHKDLWDDDNKQTLNATGGGGNAHSMEAIAASMVD